AWAAEIIINDLDRSPARLPGPISESILPPAALRIVQELIGRRLADVDEGASAQMLSRYLGHRRPRRLPAPLRSRAAGLRPALPVESSALVALRTARRSRTDPPVGLRACGSLLAFSILESDWRKLRSASISERRDRKASRESRGSARSWWCAADSCVIQEGMQAIDPSGWGMTINSAPR